MTVDEIRRPSGGVPSHQALDNILPGLIGQVNIGFYSKQRRITQSTVKFNCNQGPGRPDGSFRALAPLLRSATVNYGYLKSGAAWFFCSLFEALT